jgi:exopolysaccharide production protein ExoQ
MSTFSVPIYEPRERPAIWNAPWQTGLVLFVLFGAACWAWDASQRWYETAAGDVDALANRISEGTMNRQIAFALMGVYGIGMLMIPAARSMRLKLLVAYPAIVFVGWAMLSVVWSADASQTVKRLVVLFAMLSLILAVIRRYDLREIAQLGLISAGLTMLVGIGNEARILLTDMPDLGLWRFGGTMHPNHAGLNAAIVMLTSLYLFRFNKNKLFVLTFGIGTGVLLLTKSRTALMATATACAAFLLLATSASRVVWAGLIGAWLVAAVMWLSSMNALSSGNLKSVVAMGREDVKEADVTKLTGRTDIWKFSVTHAAKQPTRLLVGYGYESFWTAENARAVSEVVNFKISEGHSAYLEWFLELGVVGAALYLFVYLASLMRWARAARMLGSPSAALAAAALIGAMLHGVSESSTGDANLPTFFIYAAIASACLLRPDEEMYV